MTAYDSLAPHYAAGRVGYSNELYAMMVQFGLDQRMHVLDVGCGTGLSSQFLIENGYRVTGVDVSAPMLAVAKERFPSGNWSEARAEALPFEDGAFDAAVSGQTFHHFDRARALGEMVRTIKPGGMLAIWWKHVVDGDVVARVRNEVSRQLGVEPPPSGLTGGFKEFYAAGLRDPQLRVVPWHVTVPVEDYVNYERSRKSVRDAFGDRAGNYFETLGHRLLDVLAGRSAYLPVSYIQYLYMARKPLE